MTLDLSPEETRLLHEHLDRHIQETEMELVRTDKRELQHALNLEVEGLRAISERLAEVLGGRAGS